MADVIARTGAARWRLPLGVDGRRDSRATPAPGTLSLLTTSVSVSEGGQFTITLRRAGGSDGAVAVDWAVAGATTTPQNGTVNWAAADSTDKSVQITAGLVADTIAAAINLSNARRTDGGQTQPVLGTASGTVTVVNSPDPTSWNLPATLNVQQSGNIPLRQYAVNATGWTISVSGLPTGVTYNAGTESLEGASTGTGSATATFTLSLAGQADVVDTATVALVEVGSTLVHGELFTITGSGFGTKPAQTPYKYWGGSGTPTWSDTQGDNAAFRDSGYRGVSTPNARIPRYWSAYRGSNLNIFLLQNFTPSSLPLDIYASWYVRADPNWTAAGSGDMQHKPWTYGRGSWYSVPHVYIGYENLTTSGTTNSPGLRYGGDPGFPGFSGWGSDAANITQGWVRKEVLLRLTTESDGFHHYYEVTPIGSLGARLVLSGSGRTEFSGTTAQSYFMFGGYTRDSHLNNWMYFTDVFMDFGLNRVVLTDTATYSSASMREPQPYTAWSDSSITLTANCGGLPTGSTAYLHVISGVGTVLKTQQVTIGG